jgi:hypothetical protein
MVGNNKHIYLLEIEYFYFYFCIEKKNG